MLFEAAVWHEARCRIPKRVPTAAEWILNSCRTKFQRVAAELVTHQSSHFSLCPAERSRSEADIKAQPHHPDPLGHWPLTSHPTPHDLAPQRLHRLPPLPSQKATRGLGSGTGTHQEHDGDLLGATPALRWVPRWNPLHVSELQLQHSFHTQLPRHLITFPRTSEVGDVTMTVILSPHFNHLPPNVWPLECNPERSRLRSDQRPHHHKLPTIP